MQANSALSACNITKTYNKKIEIEQHFFSMQYSLAAFSRSNPLTISDKLGSRNGGNKTGAAQQGVSLQVWVMRHGCTTYKA